MLVKLRYDLYYIKNRSPPLDLKILVRTVWIILSFQRHLSEHSCRFLHDAGKRFSVCAHLECRPRQGSRVSSSTG